MTKKENALMFEINDSFSFQMAIVLMSFMDNSPDIIKNSDIIILNDGIAKENESILQSIVDNIIFYDMRNDNLLHKEIINERNGDIAARHGKYIMYKLKAFDLIKEYKKVIHLDADMLVYGDMSSLLSYQCDIAYRRSVYKVYEMLNIKKENAKSDCIGVFGPCIVFNNSLLKYNIDCNKIYEAFRIVHGKQPGSLEERLIGYLIYNNQMSHEHIPSTTMSSIREFKTAISNSLHYYDDQGGQKPWLDSAVNFAFPEWNYYYKKWLKLGGGGKYTPMMLIYQHIQWLKIMNII